MTTGTEAVLHMRDQFLQFAKCCAAVRDYSGARDALDIAQSLERFEANHNITMIVWPARISDLTNEWVEVKYE